MIFVYVSHFEEIAKWHKEVKMEIFERPIAITDVETTGLDFKIHEVVEIGLAVFDQKTFKILDEFESKVKPQNISTATQFALELNGYNRKDWKNALSLRGAMEIYSEKTKDAIFCAQNITFDRSFISEAFWETGVKNLMDYHRIDLVAIAGEKARGGKLPGLTKLNLDALCEYFCTLKEPKPHRAINGVRNEFEVLRRLLKI